MRDEIKKIRYAEGDIIRWCSEALLVIGAVGYNLNIMYLIFGIEVIRVLKVGKLSMDKMVSIAILSIMLPDNYSTIALILILGCIDLFSKQKRKINKELVILFLVIILSTCISLVPMINVFFFLVYFLPLFILLKLISDENTFDSNQFESSIRKLMSIELVATITNFILAIMRGLLGVYSDWSTGTFGVAQMSQFCLFALFMMIINFYWYKKKKQGIINVFIWALITISTNCWSMTILAAIGAAMFYLPSLKNKHLKKVAFVFPVLIVALIFAKYYIPDIIWNDIHRIFTNTDYRLYRFAKLEVYKNTFITLPRQDIKFFLLGNGAGYYDSRAALTCTGHYVGSYLKFFPESMSEYTKNYIYPQLSNAFFQGDTDYGSVLYRPYSSVIAIMGETGIFGLICSIIIFVKTCQKKTKYSLVILGIFASVCFLESYLEYSKIVLLVFSVLIILEARRENKWE